MFIISIDNYNIPFYIKNIHYINARMKTEHYILNLWSGPYDEMSELANIDIKININYKDKKISYHKQIDEKIFTANQNIFIRLRNKFLQNNICKCLILKLLFHDYNILDIYYY